MTELPVSTTNPTGRWFMNDWVTEQVWGLCLRCLGAMHMIQYLSLRYTHVVHSGWHHRNQVHGLIGPEGIQPIRESLSGERKKHGFLKGLLRFVLFGDWFVVVNTCDCCLVVWFPPATREARVRFPAVAHFFFCCVVADYGRVPTLFWLSQSTAMISLVMNAGLLFSVLLMLGINSQLCTFILYVLYLSLTNGGGNFILFPWYTSFFFGSHLHEGFPFNWNDPTILFITTTLSPLFHLFPLCTICAFSVTGIFYKISTVPPHAWVWHWKVLVYGWGNFTR